LAQALPPAEKAGQCFGPPPASSYANRPAAKFAANLRLGVLTHDYDNPQKNEIVQQIALAIIFNHWL
jgi:hypothetical protein